MIGVSPVQQMRGKDRRREATFCSLWYEKQKANTLQERKYHQKKPDLNS
jgi:hypothetical protein